MKKNIAVVGCGNWGKNLIRNFAELDSLAAVCDSNKQLAQSYAKQCGVDDLSFKSILAYPNIEGVVLAVPASLHASMSLEAMNAGKNVYVEKPLAMHKLEAEKMIESAKENNVRLMVGHLLIYHPVFKALRNLIESGKLGALRYIYSNRLSLGRVRSEEDVIWSFAPHDISMILAITGQEPEVVRTESSFILQPDIADTSIIHMEFSSSIKAHVSVSWLNPFKEQKFVVVGEDAMAVFDDTNLWKEKLVIYHYVMKTSDGLPIIENSKLEFVKVQKSEPLKNECRHFSDVVNKNLMPMTNGSEGLKVLNVLSAASLSQNKKRAIRLATK